MSAVQQRKVHSDEDGMRLDRWFALHFPQLGFGRLQKLIRNGEVKVDRSKVATSTRLSPGQVVRIPPIDDPDTVKPIKLNNEDADFIRTLILYEDDDIYVLNKPFGLAVQGGSGTFRHLDGMLKSLPNKKGEAPRLVHRLDRDTSGCLIVAKTHAAASHFGAVFRSRSARKIYWAVVAGNPTPRQGEISCFLGKRKTPDGEQVVVVKNGTPGAQHSMSYYSTTDTASRRFAWLTLKPVTGRTHQLRVHTAQLGTPIINDPRYFNIENWQGAVGLGEGLHLHARRIALPLRSGKRLDVSAPLPPHMQQTFDALGFDAGRYDAQAGDPEEEA
ncbi:RluA family pseudouridine synthase [Devosia rhodophyticola]|uniref:Pseudouridine synthase n=1 Tax=Devosia rhodophyticola TaxID=3026423 RepID=A0ABY7YX39_9HYPH|nr:RluA family pseudouridine synthase [Devosia rhodophyticola]WDR05943.1 RluA family pseudouridine synthase [Devosia rhodophyticola]